MLRPPRADLRWDPNDQESSPTGGPALAKCFVTEKIRNSPQRPFQELPSDERRKAVGTAPIALRKANLLLFFPRAVHNARGA